MDYITKDSIHFYTAEGLKNLYHKNMNNRNMYHFRDDKNRAVWSFDELLWMFHYYIFGNDGTLIETGFAHMSPQVLTQFTDRIHLPSQQVTSFIINYPIQYNIRRLRPQPVIAATPAPNPVGLVVVPADISSGTIAKPADETVKRKPERNTMAPPAPVVLSMLTSYKILLQPINSFADRVISAVFTTCKTIPGEDMPDHWHPQNTIKDYRVTLTAMSYTPTWSYLSLSLIQASPCHDPPVPGTS